MGELSGRLWQVTIGRLARPVVLTAALVVAAAAVGVAVAQTVGNTYTGCLSSRGSLTNVAIGTEPTKQCGSGATQVSWNETGTEGPTGPTGPQGPRVRPGTLPSPARDVSRAVS